MPTIAVAMCTFNGGDYVQKQLESIVMQSRKPDELVVCDDRSSDHTRELISALTKKAPFAVTLRVNEQRLGSTANFERVIGECRGEIIVLSDQDDIWYPDKLACIEKAFEMGGVSLGGIFSDADLMDAEGKMLGSRMWQYFGFNRRLQERVHTGQTFDVLLQKHVVPGCTMAFRREYRDLITPFPSVGIHDRWIALLIAAVAKFDAIPRPLLKYRKHKNQQQGVALTSLSVALQKGSVREQVVRAKRPAASIYGDLATLYEEAATRLSRMGDYGVRDEVLESLRGKVAHLRVRAGLPRSPVLRLCKVFSEFRNRHYHRYSNGVYSLVRDILVGR